jgi:hypothetical protein
MSDFIFKPDLCILQTPFVRDVIFICFNAANTCSAHLSATLDAATSHNEPGVLEPWDRMDSKKKRNAISQMHQKLNRPVILEIHCAGKHVRVPIVYAASRRTWNLGEVVNARYRSTRGTDPQPRVATTLEASPRPHPRLQFCNASNAI